MRMIEIKESDYDKTLDKLHKVKKCIHELITIWEDTESGERDDMYDDDDFESGERRGRMTGRSGRRGMSGRRGGASSRYDY